MCARTIALRAASLRATFLCFEAPDAMVHEHSSGVRSIPPEQEAGHQPRQFPRANALFCMWGSAPDIDEFKRDSAGTQCAAALR
jgi:hypothetical protein